jgi:hypothetical protein
MPIAKQITLPLAEWADLEIPMLQMESGEGYIPVRPLCRALLGVDDDKPQRARIRRDPILSQLTTYLPVQTAGGTQDMLCLAWLGVGRWIDRLDLDSVKDAYRTRLLDIMWAITFAAYEVISGKRALPALLTIVPSARLLTAFREEDVRRFLHLLAERIGRMEIATRDAQTVLLAMAGVSQRDGVCPCCGRVDSTP